MTCELRKRCIAATVDNCPHRRRRYRASHRGAAAVEFALTIPLMVLLALASVDFGRISHFDEVVANAARAGAAAGAARQFTDFTRVDWESQIRDTVLHEMQNLPEFDGGSVTCSIQTTTDTDGIVKVRVEVSYPFRTIVDWAALPSEVILHGRCEFRQFR
jgi:Flp pilus assembly protein TadG